MAGSDPETDLAIEKLPAIKTFLQQGLNESFDVESSFQLLNTLLATAVQQQPDQLPAVNGR